MTWTRETIDGFTERDEEDLRTFVFYGDDRTSVLSRIGVEVARPIGSGRVAAVPALRVAWFHEFADSSRSIDADRYGVPDSSGVPNPDRFTSLSFPTDDPDRDFFTFGGGIAVAVSDAGSLMLDYQTLLGHDYIDEQFVRLGVTYRF